MYLFVVFIVEHVLHMPFSPAVHGGVDRAVGAHSAGMMGALGAGGAHADGRLHGVRGGGRAGHGDLGPPWSGAAALVIVLVGSRLKTPDIIPSVILFLIGTAGGAIVFTLIRYLSRIEFKIECYLN